jgi:polysaccharide export outer membrane protein
MRNLTVALVVLLLAQSAGQAQQPAGAVPSPATGYTVGAADVLKVVVFNEPSLSGSFRVDDDGSVTYPLIGRVAVSGLTVREIEARIKSALLDGYVRNPQVSVEMEQYRSRSIFIMGEVRTPGKYPLTESVQLLEVLAMAGSTSASASSELLVLRPRDAAAKGAPVLPEDPGSTTVFRVSMADLEAGVLSANISLQDGDTVYVPKAERFYVIGQVRNPGAFVLERNMTVEQGIALAGGFTERGSTRGIKIRRQVGPNEFKEFEVKRTDAIQAGDTIIVRQRFI